MPLETKVPSDKQWYPTTEEWRAAGLKTLGCGPGRVYWEQMGLMTWSYALLNALAFGFIGFCLGTKNGVKAEVILSLFFSVPGAIWGAFLGFMQVFIGRRIAAWRVRGVLKKKHL